VVEDPVQIAKAQSHLMRNLKFALVPMGPRTIGFRGGNVVHPIFANGDGGLYYAYSEPRDDVPIKKHWNSFGVFRKDASAQLITVEINIPVGGNRPMVAGYFATDGATKKTYLMHNGAIGGGRKGIGQEAFLNYAAMPEVIVSTSSGTRRGLVIGDVSDPNLSALIWRYVRVVEQFKTEVAAGSLTETLPGVPSDETNYSPEFWGPKSGAGKEFDYVALFPVSTYGPDLRL
jgi:5-methylcytosine-specific restriction protein A